MSLRRKIIFKDAALCASLLLMIFGSLWGFLRQRSHVQASLDEYTALEYVQTGQARLMAFEQSLHDGKMDQPQAVEDLRAAERQLRLYKAVVTQYDNILPLEITPDLQSMVKTKTKRIVTGLIQLTAQVDPARRRPDQPPVNVAQLSASVDSLSRELTDLLAMCNGFVHRTEMESAKDLRMSMIVVSTVAVVAVLLAILTSIWQYRLMMLPLNRLRRWCRLTANGDFSTPYQASRDREFADLAEDVNRMAAALDAFGRRMESMVASKSRELIRSERLASVGYLAAGVAHEINNPLNIMSGYAELTIKRLRRAAGEDQTSEVIQHLGIIRSEAFRCKEITQKLLSLAKGNGDAREELLISDVIDEVVILVRGLKAMRSKQLEVKIPQQPLVVVANPTEIKQVLLNLLINAIEAVPDGSGRIAVDTHSADGWVQITVSDNGRGMSDETRERVFEPFFTNKRGAGDPGTGLGLSITHAIVTDHGGEITAHSDGPGKGSRFIIRLRAAGVPLAVYRRTQSVKLTAALP